jgi:hypothetical protein
MNTFAIIGVVLFLVGIVTMCLVDYEFLYGGAETLPKKWWFGFGLALSGIFSVFSFLVWTFFNMV